MAILKIFLLQHDKKYNKFQQKKTKEKIEKVDGFYNVNRLLINKILNFSQKIIKLIEKKRKNKLKIILN